MRHLQSATPKLPNGSKMSWTLLTIWIALLSDLVSLGTGNDRLDAQRFVNPSISEPGHRIKVNSESRGPGRRGLSDEAREYATELESEEEKHDDEDSGPAFMIRGGRSGRPALFAPLHRRPISYIAPTPGCSPILRC
jgi:hypothetical protein